MNTTTKTRLSTVVRALPKLSPVPAKRDDQKTHVTIRHTTLPQPRALMLHEVRETGARSGFSVRIGGESGFRELKTLAGTIRLHLGDRTLATAAKILIRLAK